MQHAINLIEALGYKLHVMGVPIETETKVYHDNELVEVTLTKKEHNVINYH